MLRLTIALTMLGTAQSAALAKSAPNGNGFCYGYKGANSNTWCWLTATGHKDYVKNGDGGWKCSDYDGYKDSSYCEDEAKQTHTSNSHEEPAGGLDHSGSEGAEASGKPLSGSGCGKGGWKCPASWTTGGSAPAETPDAKAYVAAHNIYRCMHDVPAAQWDADVYKGAKSWSQSSARYGMSHSVGSSAYRKGSDGENLAGTFKYSSKRGVDATHMWYEEINNPCGRKQSCYQSFQAGHFTAMIWRTMTKIAYSDTDKELAVGRYRGCDGSPPNFNAAYAANVPVPKYNWAHCAQKVLSCSAFSGLVEDDVEGCKSSSAWSSNTDWHMVYATKCSHEYARLYNTPALFQPLMSNPLPVAGALAGGLVFFVGLVVRRRRTQEVRQDAELLEGSDGGSE